ncbi:hypothetical protein [Flavobacterium gawalongense]|uniref:DUF695 domain-containing protein n=1 Tax=Flavobacterium gawalongense TaxID=2594432 RepID=A0ABY3CKR5_9FLAO|nr:hypothetical protein [Flavobacterium gawalongense]TRX01370.1 hypothetical protein FNW33_09670 [Flavobacterium gawalongense]TRX05894.1 hypothetical protein FNW12_09755 [Flavobacterium gawalongense]
MKSINTFWNWFQENNQTIKNLINETPKNQKHISFWINKNLSYYCKEIDFMIVFPKIGNTKSELIITANGNPEHFNQVIDLVDNAPQLKNWKFTAFIQPTERIDKITDGFDEPFIFHEITLKASELKFLTLDYDEETQKFDIIVFLKNYHFYCDTKTLEQAVFIIIQDILGENSLFQNINFVQLAQMPDNNEDLIHLYDFQMFIDSLNIEN